MTQHRTFATGATRDTAEGKYDYDGFLSPYVVEAFGAYMDHNRVMADGSKRDSDNWQKGIPREAYMKSAWRHFLDWWREHRGLATKEGIVWALLGLLFNLQGYLHELLKEDPALLDAALSAAEHRRELARMRDTKPCMTARTQKFAKALLSGDPGSCGGVVRDGVMHESPVSCGGTGKTEAFPQAGAFHD